MTTGLLLTMLGGTMCVSLVLLTQHTRHWGGRISHLVRSALALLVVPLAIALLTVPHLGRVYAQAGVWPLTVAAGSGSLWGVAILVFAWSCRWLGPSLVLPAAGGFAAVGGSMVPLLLLHPGRIGTAGAWTLIAGVVLLQIAAVLFVASGRPPGDGDLRHALIACAACGILASFLNLGLALGRPITAVAERHGSTPAASTNAILPLVLAGAFLVDLLYGLLRPDDAFVVLRSVPVKRLLRFSVTIVFGLLAGVTCVVYAAAITVLGDFGAIAGWPVLVAVIGVSTGIWELASERPRAAGWRFKTAAVALFTAAGGLAGYAVSLLDRGL